MKPKNYLPSINYRRMDARRQAAMDADLEDFEKGVIMKEDNNINNEDFKKYFGGDTISPEDCNILTEDYLKNIKELKNVQEF